MDEFIAYLIKHPRFWSDPDYRGNVIELMRLQRSRSIVRKVLTLQERIEALSNEFLFLNS